MFRLAMTEAAWTVATVTISPDYFQTLGATVHQGRAFTEADGASAVPVAIINQHFASLSWPGEDPIGKRLRLFRGPTPGSWLTVVGVVSNIVQDDRTGHRLIRWVYRPFQQEPEMVLWVLGANTRPAGESLRRRFDEVSKLIDADLRPARRGSNVGIASPLDELLKNNYRSNSVNGILFLIFAAIALLLALVGL